MSIYNNSIKLFGENELFQVLRSKLDKIKQKIESENDDYILKVNKKDFVNYLVNQNKIDELIVHIDKIEVSQSEEYVEVNDIFNKNKTNKIKCDVYTFHIPFSGQHDIIKLRPSTRLLWSPQVGYKDNEILFKVIDRHKDSKQISNEKNQFIEKLLKQVDNINKDLREYNSKLSSNIERLIRSRKDKILKSRGILSELGVPIRKADCVSKTFSIPIAKNNPLKILERPITNNKAFKPEPALDTKTYNDILKIIHDVGKNFERYPSTYLEKNEEALRDHFLIVLQPNFIGSATGETFNKRGKTDILLRYENNNVFIAECKFWHGEKSYFRTIDQLLNYLTWRDSKAAIILFVRNKDLSDVISKVKIITPNHKNFLEYVNDMEETWLNYKFHINNDRNREIMLAVMLYHIPT